MKDCFTHDRIVAFVERCERMGINAWQTGHGPDEKIVRALGTLRERGSKVHWFCLAWEGEGHRPLGEVLALKPIAVVHHEARRGLSYDFFSSTKLLARPHDPSRSWPGRGYA